ncbi:hypothetical protein SAMN05216344_11620 [Polaromonas sp. OV174]|nr:hypothetical protein SAMN05216344_11620 [Polaromonas sp. OV174]
MFHFTIRVVLYDNATWEDYKRLASALAAKNITDVITADDGARYKLPSAEYQCQGELSAEDVRKICSNAATMTGKRHAVLVTASAGRAWSGLSRV